MMKRTEKKFKSKSIKGCEFTHRLCEKYDRNYVAKRMKDVIHLPFTRTSARIWDVRYNVRLNHYLSLWFKKQVGKSVDDVFHNFVNLGWDNTSDMYFNWDYTVRSKDQDWYYYADENGCLTPSSWNQTDSSPKSKNAGDEEEREPKPKAKKAKC